MITIKDIAEKLGVSPSTVARALADNKHISRATKDRVTAAARELGYVANSAARVMRGESNALVGLTIPSIENDIDTRLARSVAETCRARSYQLVLSITEDDPEVEFNQVHALVSARAAGLIAIPTRKPKPETLALINRIPTVQLVRQVPRVEADCFKVDEPYAMAIAVAHLAELGHRRIAYVGIDRSVSNGPARLEGYEQGMSAAGLDVLPELIALTPSDEAASKQASARLLDTARPTAIICGGSAITAGILRLITERGIVVPRDLSIVAYGNSDWHEFYRPSLTSIAIPTQELATAGSGRLLDRLGPPGSRMREEDTIFAHALFRPSLIARGSTSRIAS